MIDGGTLDCYRNLSQHYEAEFSPLTGKKPDLHGLYAITELTEHDKGYLYLAEEGTPLGFAVIHKVGECYDVAEFYVIPTARCQGVGKKMIFEIFDRHPGKWQVRQIAGADGAHRFWVAVIDEYTGGYFVNEVCADPEWGTVRRQLFSTAAAIAVDAACGVP
jgi:predicted acetyltransferase